MLAHWVWLSSRKNLSDGLKWRILQAYGDPEKVYFADSYEDVVDLPIKAYDSLMDKDLTEAQKILENCLRYKLKILTMADPQYPEKLRNIFDPPLILYYKGKLPDFDHHAVVAVVGTRKATGYGLQAAKRLGYQIARSGGILVSGMALGIDGMAMEGALMGGSPLAGVLGCGPEQIYPLKNRKLFEDTERYGCILSEFPPETKTAPWNFPRRNRIISGLSDAVLVVEAPKKSGALITARQALEQGRDVFVVPGNIGIRESEGSNGLLREGAGAVSCGWDILSEYVSRYPDTLKEDPLPREGEREAMAAVAEPRSAPQKAFKNEPVNREKSQPFGGETHVKPEGKEKLSIDNRASEPYIDINDILQRCNSQEKAIVMALKDGEALVDSIIETTGLPSKDVLAGLTMLEIKGILCRLPGRRVTLKRKK